MSISSRLAQLRQSMAQQQIQAWIVPSADPHLSEYLPAFWQQREWISGFTGSVGTALITPDFAGLWADSRYWEQATAQLNDSGFTLMKMGEAGVPSLNEWLQQLPSGSRVGVNPYMISLQAFNQLAVDLHAHGLQLYTAQDLLAPLWADRPALPCAAIYEHPTTFVSQSRASKLDSVRQQMQAHGAHAHLISSLDDITWLLNLRGADVDYNPVFLGHVLLTADKTQLFVHEGKVSSELRSELAQDGVQLCDYDALAATLANLPKHTRLWVDPERVCAGVLQGLSLPLYQAVNPSRLFKSQKSPADLAHVREAMEQDGAALCHFFAWLEAALLKGEHEGQPITELTIDEQICAARAQQPHFVCPSFPTIAGYNANGAMPHYRATAESYATIAGNGFLLIDSGGQYFNGTTDITRVVPVGNLTPEQQRDYTVVLKGMIQLSMAHFPRDYPSPLLDTLARNPMWQAGLDYGHGTGHGVGYFLNVHEGPQVIAHRAYRLQHHEMKEGMITSNEPGVYRPGQWGVRIENLVANVPAQTTEFVDTLKFETLTLCPIDTRPVLVALLTAEERQWLNDYHATVRKRLSPRVQGAALAWLEKRTAPI